MCMDASSPHSITIMKAKQMFRSLFLVIILLICLHVLDYLFFCLFNLFGCCFALLLSFVVPYTCYFTLLVHLVVAFYCFPLLLDLIVLLCCCVLLSSFTNSPYCYALLLQFEIPFWSLLLHLVCYYALFVILCLNFVGLILPPSPPQFFCANLGMVNFKFSSPSAIKFSPSFLFYF
jgi:hypothetical protein